MTGGSSLLCCRKKKIHQVHNPKEREDIAKRRWRKIWLLRNLLVTADEAKLKAKDYAKGLYEGISIEAGHEHVVKKKWIVYPWSFSKRAWDLLIGGLKVYYCFSIPWYLAFGGNYEGSVIPWDFAFDILLFIDLIIRFFSAFVVDSKLIDDQTEIIKRAIKEGFIIDLICVIPWYAVYNELMWFRILRLLQVTQLRTALEKAKLLEKLLDWLSFNDYNSKQSFLRITNFIMMLCVICHNITCFFYLLAKNEDIPIETTYLGNADLNNEQIYVKTLYYVITTISTVGYGDISPKTSKEIAFVMFIQFLGVVIFAYLTGNITSILMNLNQREKMLSEKEINLDKWFLDMKTNKSHSIPEDLHKSIREYFLYYWENDHSSLLTETNFLMRMPLNLRNQFLDYLFSDEIKHFQVFFNDLDLPLKYQMMLSMFPRIVEEKAIAVEKNDEVEEIFIIRRGKVLLTTKNNVSFLVLGEKSFFGEEFVLFDIRPKINFVADEGGLECFCIKKGKYLEMLDRFPNSYQVLIRRAFKRNKYFEAVMFSSVNNDDIGEDGVKFIKTKSMKSGANDYLENFSWDLTDEETLELKDLIKKKSETTVKDKIVENIQSNQKTMNILQDNVEKITKKVDQIKQFYEKDMKDLVNIITLLRDGQTTEANKVLSSLKLS